MPTDYSHGTRAESTPPPDISAARWLLQFCREDVPLANTQELRHLQIKVLAFLGRHEERTDRYPDRNQIHTWRDELKAKLLSLSKGGIWQMRSKAIRIAQNNRGRVLVQRLYRPSTAAWWDFLPRAFDCLTSCPLRFCSNDSCVNVFIGNKRAQYCSVRCRSAASKRRYRQRHRPNRR